MRNSSITASGSRRSAYMLQAAIDQSQKDVEGEVTLKLYKGKRHRRRPRIREVALFRLASLPSRTTTAPTTRRTLPASSSSTRYACARWPSATRRTDRTPRSNDCKGRSGKPGRLFSSGSREWKELQIGDIGEDRGGLHGGQQRAIGPEAARQTGHRQAPWQSPPPSE